LSPGDAVANLARSVIATLARAVVPGNSNTTACELIGPETTPTDDVRRGRSTRDGGEVVSARQGRICNDGGC